MKEDSEVARFAQLQKQFANGEITEEELESEIDDIMSDDGEITGDTLRDKRLAFLKFHARQIGELIAFGSVFAIIVFLVLFTNGAAVLPLFILSAFIIMYLLIYRNT